MGSVVRITGGENRGTAWGTDLPEVTGRVAVSLQRCALLLLPYHAGCQRVGMSESAKASGVSLKQ